MKKSQNSEKSIFYKKINRISKNASSIKKIDTSSNINYPLIINGKNNTYQNSKENNLSNTSNKANSPNKNKEMLKRKNSYKFVFSVPKIKDKSSQAITSLENISKIKKLSPKDILMKRVSRFLFSKKNLKLKLKDGLETDNFMHISSNTNNDNSINLLNYKQIHNLNFSSLNENTNLASIVHTTRSFSNNNNSTKLNKFKYKLFKYSLSKQKSKIEKLLYDIKKSEMMEIRKINLKLLKLKAKTFNSKSKKKDIKS